ncbi:MAG TPA: hypothetical protein VH682_14590 [Gemmataceae bacterium]
MCKAPRYCRVLFWPLAAWPLLLAGQARADTHCYMLIFAAQTHPKIPRLTHTFGTIVKVTDAPPGSAAPCLEVYTISWLPRTLKVHPYRLHDEPGRNLTLEETLSWAFDNHMDVSEWGPYAIEPNFFARVYNEYARIERGEFRYKAIDPRQRGARTTDCIHAVTDIDQLDSRNTYPFLRSGDAATRKFVRVLRELGRLMVPPDDVSWLDAALGLDRYPVLHCLNP